MSTATAVAGTRRKAVTKDETKTPIKSVKVKPEVSSDKFAVGQYPEIDLSLGKEVEIVTNLEMPDGPVLSDYLKELAFNEEMVEVEVHETNDENAIPMVDVYVNGVVQYFPRGIKVRCKRKFLEGLVIAKPMSIRAQATIPGSGQEPINKVTRNSALAYPFTVHEDKNPNGQAWLRMIMARG